MSTLIVTEREGTVIISVAAVDGATRQRAALDVEGTDLSHAELAEFAQDLSSRFRWNGTPALEPPKADPPKSLPAAPKAGALTKAERERERKRAYNREYYRRNHSTAAKAKSAPRKAAAPAPPQGGKSPRRSPRDPAAAEAFRQVMLADVREHPGTTSLEVATRLSEPSASTTVYLRSLMDAGLIRREGAGGVGSPYRYHALTIPAPIPSTDPSEDPQTP